VKPIRILLDLLARRRLRRIAARRIREMLAAPDSGRRLGYPAARRVETMESVLRVRDDRSDAELEPDILLPSQLGDGLFGGARLQPEKRLQLAVLVPVLTQPWTPELGLDALRRSVPTDDAAHGSASGRGVGYIRPTLQLTRTGSIQRSDNNG